MAIDGSTEYRGIGYSITDLKNGKWRWKLHPKKPDISSSGEAPTHDDAVAGAKRAIDAGWSH